LDNKSLVRVYFELNAEEYHGGGLEGIWAEPFETSPSGTVYRLLNSPFYAKGISYQDIIRTAPRFDGGEGQMFAGVIEHSGHSTYMILVPSEFAEFDVFWKKLEELGCTYEYAGIKETGLGHNKLYSINVPKTSDIFKVYEILEEGERKRAWLFQEGFCGHDVNS
jgi:Domain of unknown function (DUF4265)